MKQGKIIILLITTFVLLCACPDKEEGHSYITFINQSERDISCQDFWSGHITGADTLFQCGIGAVGIPVDSLCNFPSLNYFGWETDFRAIPYIQFLIIDDSTYVHYSKMFNYQLIENCDSIRKYVPVLHIYQLTLADLQRMNWTVVYPPEAE